MGIEGDKQDVGGGAEETPGDSVGLYEVPSAEVARAYGVTLAALGKWRREWGFPAPRRRGWYSLADVLRWERAARDEARGRGVANADERLKLVKAQRQEVALSKDLGKLVDRDAALRSVERGIAEFSGQMRNLPRRVAALVPQDFRVEVEESVAREVVVSLKSLSQCRDIGEAPAVEPEIEGEEGEDD